MFSVALQQDKTTNEIKLLINNKSYAWGTFDSGIPAKTLKQIYLDNNRDIDGITKFIQDVVFISDEYSEKKLSTENLMILRNTNPFYLYILSLIGYLCLYTLEVDEKDFEEYTAKELINIDTKDEFVACLLSNMIELFKEVKLNLVFYNKNDNSILIGLDSQNRAIYKEGSNDIGQEEEMPKWVC